VAGSGCTEERWVNSDLSCGLVDYHPSSPCLSKGELLGEETARRAYGYLKPFDEGFANALFNTTFGDIWCRPGLPTKKFAR
jgi:hypothetical protein